MTASVRRHHATGGSTTLRTRILRRHLIQLAIGIVVGGLLAFWSSSADSVTVGLGFGVVAYALVMLSVCLLACVVPAQRVLKVNPIDVLRAD